MEIQLVRRPDGPQAWEDHKALIVDLYITRGLELGEVMNIMEKDHFFKATEKQYKSHFTEWGIRKNVKSNEWNAILRKKRKREQKGKESAFRLRGTRVNSMRVVREEKRRRLGDESRLAEAVTPPDLICSTPSPVAYIPAARSPILSPLQLSEPSSISILLSFQRDLEALRPGDLHPDKWPDTALDRDNITKSFLGLSIDMVDPLLYEERYIFTYVIQTTILMSNGCFLCWAKLILEMLEASRARNKPSKRDDGNISYKWIVKLVINHLANGPHRKLCGWGPFFVGTMDSFEQLLRTIETHAISKQTLKLASILRICTAHTHNLVDSDQYGAASLFLNIMSRVFERWAVGEDLDNPQTGADSHYRPEGSLLSYPLVERLKESMCDFHLMRTEMWRAVRPTKKLLEQDFMGAHDRIGSPTPPSPGSDRSQISFLSDSVVDWKELRRGLSPYKTIQGNEEAWIDKLEALE